MAERLAERALNALDRGLGPAGRVRILRGKARHKGVEVSRREGIVEVLQALPHLDEHELAHDIVAADHAVKDGLVRLRGSTGCHEAG